MKKFTLFLLLVLLSACAAEPAGTERPTSLPSTAGEAQQALISFFELLSVKKYAEADSLYGGSYEQLQIFNTEADPSDHAALWAWSCEMSGLQCLKIRTAVFKSLQGDTHIFQVEFSNRDGSLFVLGPCCGANETEMPPVSQFEYRVSRTAPGKFSVMDLPPYVP